MRAVCSPLLFRIPLPFVLSLLLVDCTSENQASWIPVPTPELHHLTELPPTTHADESTRTRIDLGGSWTMRFDDDDRGVAERWFHPSHDRSDWALVQVPGAWDLEHPDGFNRKTIGWYSTEITPPHLGEFVRLGFEGVFREAQVWMNGTELGRYDLPYLPFQFNVTGRYQPDQPNSIVVRIDNRLDRRSLPADTLFNPGRHGWFPYGGITRPVYLEGGMEPSPSQVLIDSKMDGRFSALVTLHRVGPQHRNATLAAAIDRSGHILFQWPSITLRATDTPGWMLQAKISNPDLWSPENPHATYRLTLSLTRDDSSESSSYEFGFREFTAREGRFFLNGEDRFLRGINLHEDHPQHGPVYTEGSTQIDTGLLQGLRADFLRPGHYPNDVRRLKAYERSGMMLVEEIPVYQLDAEQMADPDLVDRARRALEAMIIRDFNRPGIVMWSLANEIHNWADSSTPFVETLAETARGLDNRPLMVAALTAPPLSLLDVSSGAVDVIGVNEYFGWYVGKTSDVSDYLERLQRRFPDKTFLVSEYGAGALRGRRSTGSVGEEPSNDHSYTEDFQVYFHREHLRQFQSFPFVRGLMPWVLADFRMEWTPTTGQPHPVPLMNLKGLVSDDRIPKASYGFVADAYDRIYEAAASD